MQRRHRSRGGGAGDCRTNWYGATSPALWSSYHLATLRRHPAVFLELDAHGGAGDHRLDGARRAERLFAVVVALPRRHDRVRHHDPWRVFTGADAPGALGHRVARSGAVQHDHRPRADPYRAGNELHHAILPQLLCFHTAGFAEGGAYRWRGIFSHLLAHRVAAFTADPDRDGDLAIHRDLERVPVWGHVLGRRKSADHRCPDRAERAAERCSAIR